jgi:amino acid transporter
MAERSADTNLENLGYKPQFKRVLTRRDLILYGLVFLTPTAPYPVYGIVQQLSGGHAPLSYLVAMVAMLFTAASYGKMAGAFPVAGSTYAYTQRGLNEHLGFLAGWAMILDYMLIPLLSVVYAGLTAHRLLPQVPYLVWTVLFTLLITVVNVQGIRVTARASAVLMAIMTASTVLFFWLAVKFVTASQGAAALIAPSVLYNPETFALQPLMLGAGIATLSYIGFDGVSTLAEDTVHPERDISISTITVCLIATIIFFLTVYLAALVWPVAKPFPHVDTAIIDIGRLIGGPWMLGWISFVLLVAGLASALAGQAGASRLLFGMGRDAAISRRLFGHLDARTSTPVRSVYFMGAVSLLGALIAKFQLVVELVNFGAFIGFILVNLSVIRHYYVRQRRRDGMGLLTNLAFPLFGALACTWVWMSLTGKAKLVGFLWMGAGTVYLAVITRGFRRRPRELEIS